MTVPRQDEGEGATGEVSHARLKGRVNWRGQPHQDGGDNATGEVSHTRMKGRVQLERSATPSFIPIQVSNRATLHFPGYSLPHCTAGL